MSFLNFFQRFGGDFEKRINKRVEKVLKENTFGVSSYKVEIHEDLFYLKLYYETTSPEEKNALFKEFYDAFLKYNYQLHGVTEYFDNKEICYVFLKKER